MSKELAVNRLDDSLFSKDLAPHYLQLAGKLASSDLVPKAYKGKPLDLYLAMELGYQIGMTIAQAIQGIAVINGRPCVWGDDMLALCMNHPDFVDIIEEPMVQDNTIIGYRTTVKRRGMTDELSIFTLDMARKAGLLGKPGPWTQYPERMLRMRARAFGLRNRFPDALKGIKVREEVEDYVDADYSPVVEKATRTETLKADFAAKTVDMVHGVTPMPEWKVEVQPEDTPLPVTEGQLDYLSSIMTEQNIPLERIEKALKYYEVEDIEHLSSAQAQHFIKTLEKTKEPE